MKYVDIGGRRASAIGLGVWQFGSPEWGWGRDLDEATASRIVERALELGTNLFDTAELYGRGRSEEILGAALGDRRDEAFIATKVTPTHLTRQGVVDAAGRSLSRLGVDAVGPVPGALAQPLRQPEVNDERHEGSPQRREDPPGRR